MIARLGNSIIAGRKPGSGKLDSPARIPLVPLLCWAPAECRISCTRPGARDRASVSVQRPGAVQTLAKIEEGVFRHGSHIVASNRRRPRGNWPQAQRHVRPGRAAIESAAGSGADSAVSRGRYLHHRERSAARPWGDSHTPQRPQFNMTFNLRRIIAPESGTCNTSHSEPTM